MAIIKPFKGWFYNPDRFSDWVSLTAPPYDVIAPEEQAALYDASPYNVIRLILGKKKMGDSDWDNRYTRTADILKRWVDSDVIVRSDSPSMLLTSLSYDPGDGSGKKTRWGLIALVRIEDEDSPVILPHERTFSSHRDDRLRLMRATGAQFSQIFSLYEDPENQVLDEFQGVTKTPPDVSFSHWDGTDHQMWIVRDQNILKKAEKGMKDKGLLIADGHHRYETSRNYRNAMRARFGMHPTNRTFEYTMMYMSNMADPGLTVLPSHRLIRDPEGQKPGPLPKMVENWFEVSPLPWSLKEAMDHTQELRTHIERAGRETMAFAFYRQGSEDGLLLRLKRGADKDMGDDLHKSLRKLDVLVLSRLVFQKSLGYSLEELDDEKRFSYESHMKKALSMVSEGAAGMAFLINPTRIEHVREVAAERLIMPRKSTYFFPKVLTGLVFSLMDPREHIQP
jgi:uncharacterized protein (DUF1015 family)